MKYVVVTGGVVSGLGKGISSSSIGVLLKEAGLHVTSIKIDPYLNIDAGTMSPYEHGEVYVLEDGGEVDLDLGNYERFLATRLSKDHNITTGKVYAEVLANERRGDYLGKTVQVVPHVTNCIQDWIYRASHRAIDSTMPAYDDDNATSTADNDTAINTQKKRGRRPDVCMIEVGGTVGDIESMVFLEALRQFKYRIGEDNVCHVHVSLVPVVGAVGEPKSKPTQHSVKELRAAGLSPDIILCRATQPLERDVISKISLFCMVPASHVISVHDVSNIYKVPVMLHAQRVDQMVLNKLKINKMSAESIPTWNLLAERTDKAPQTIKIALVGKYTGLGDAYLSVTKALSHGGIAANVKIDVVYVEAEQLEEEYASRGQIERQEERQAEYEAAWKQVKAANGILVPGGFGNRGVEGKIAAVKYARENKVPFFGICLGFQMAVVEYARHVVGLQNATSGEFDQDAEHPVIIFMPEVSTTHMGGTMRLGGRHSDIQKDTLAYQIYDGRTRIYERHRHRYEVNPQYVQQLQDSKHKTGPGTGLKFSGTDGERMECLELDNESHPYFFGCQYHPEFTSRPAYPNPIFTTFVQASAGKFQRKKFVQPHHTSVAAPMKKSYSHSNFKSINNMTAQRSPSASPRDMSNNGSYEEDQVTLQEFSASASGSKHSPQSGKENTANGNGVHGERANPVTKGAAVGLHTHPVSNSLSTNDKKR